jgi:hypothetical protein
MCLWPQDRLLFNTNASTNDKWVLALQVQVHMNGVGHQFNTCLPASSTQVLLSAVKCGVTREDTMHSSSQLTLSPGREHHKLFIAHTRTCMYPHLHVSVEIHCSLTRCT